MYCPECRAEYRPGFTMCADCQVALVEALPPPAEEETPSPDLEMVTVLEANNPVTVALAKSTLEEAGISYYAAGEELAVRLSAVNPLIHPWTGLQVTRDHEDAARALLNEAIAEEDLIIDADAPEAEAEAEADGDAPS